MKKSQLNAISYSYNRKRRFEALKKIDEMGLNLVYKWQKLYKTPMGFIKASDKSMLRAIKNAIENCQNKLDIAHLSSEVNTYLIEKLCEELQNLRFIENAYL